MDQRPGELDENDETTVTRTSGTGNANLRSATSADVDESERVAVRDLQTIEGDATHTTEEPEQIKEQIEQTRNQMSETIDAIQEKLSFSNLSEQVSNISEQVKEQVSEQISNAVDTAKGAVYEATIGKAGNFMQTVTKGLSNVSESMGDAGTYVVRNAKSNPLPLALIGLGVGMLLFQGGSTSRSRSYYGGGDGGRRKGNQQNQGDSTFRQVTSTATGALSGARDTVSNAAGSAYEGVGNAASSAYEGVSGAATSAYQGVSSLASSTGEQVQHVARRAQHQYERTLEHNPLAIGAIALAIGAIVGLSIPATEYENEWMGEYKENLVQTVEGTAREALERVQEVAGEVSKQVQDQTSSGGGANVSGSANIGGANISGSANVSTGKGASGGVGGSTSGSSTGKIV